MKKILIFLILAFLLSFVTLANNEFRALRKKMVETQIVARGIKDKRVIAAMFRIPRHKFVPKMWRRFTYQDRPLPIGYSQTISQPYIVALMTESLHLQGDEKVLEVGTGSGYQAAILAELAKEIFTIEILEPLAKGAENRLKDMGYKNIRVKCGNGFLGWQEEAPFNAIIVTCAPREVPSHLIEQLAGGGRMVIPVGKTKQELRLIIKAKDGSINMKTLLPVKFVPMIRQESK